MSSMTSAAEIARQAKQEMYERFKDAQEQFCDCDFIVGSDYGEPEVIKAHKIMLVMGSPVFHIMFCGGFSEAQSTSASTVSIPDLKPSAFKDLKEFMYTNFIDMKVRSFEQVSDLLSAAHKYQVLKLVDKCFDSLFKCITPENAFSALNYAIRYSYIRMKEMSMHCIQCKTNASLASAHFGYIDESALELLVVNENLKINEVDLFIAVKRWAVKECERKEMDSSDATNLRQVLIGKVLCHIRFLAMATDEFETGPAISGILTEEEIDLISKNLTRKDNSEELIAMPTHLSDITCSRNWWDVQHCKY